METLFRWLAASLLLLAATSSRATTVDMTERWYIQLDGIYYSVEPGTWNVGSNLIALGSLSTTLANCRRPGNAAQVSTINRLSYAGGTKVVYLQSQLSQYNIVPTNGVMVLNLYSATLDITCDGQVTDPTIPVPPSILFANGFE